MSAWRFGNWTFLLLFILATGVQYNDPDPIQWMALYGAAALACGLALAGRLPRAFAAVVAIAAFVWGAALATRVIGKQNLWYAEEGREMMGLFLVAIWIGLLAIRGGGPRGASSPAPR